MDTTLVNLNDRSQYVKSINNFISASKEEVNTILNILGWTEEFTFKNENLVHCPFDDSHRIPEHRLDVHLESCPRRQPGKYIDDEAVHNTSSDGQPGEKESSSSTDNQTLTEFLLPYNTNDQSTPKTLQEILQAERDAKRRRIRYRTSKVHTKSKSHTEIMRGVINSQMVAFEDWIKQEKGDVVEDEETSGKIHPDLAETKKEKSEMIWLDWNFRGNPHTRWINIIDSEKRKKSFVSEENEKELANNRKKLGRDHHSSFNDNYKMIRNKSYDEEDSSRKSSRSKDYDRRDYRDRYQKIDYSKYEYKKSKRNREDRCHSRRSRSHDRRYDIGNTSRDGSNDRYGEKEKKYKDRHDISSENCNEKRKRHRDESTDRYSEKHKKHRDDSRDRHRNRRSRSTSEKQTSADENVKYKKKNHSKKKKKPHKYSNREKSFQTSDSDSENN